MPPSNPTISTKTKKPSSNPTSNSNPSNSSITGSTSFFLCKHHHHSPSATTLNLLILLLVLFSSLFLVSSFLSHLFNALTLISPHTSLPLPLLLIFLLFAVLSIAVVEFCCPTSRRCSNPHCKGLKKSLEFDIQLHTEECLRAPASKEIDDLPSKGGAETNPEYNCLLSELRRMAPPNGRAVLLFRSRCGCAVAKLEAWGPKRGRRHKK